MPGIENSGVNAVLNGKVALVTEAGRGIGKAIAARLQEAGAHVVLNDIDEANLRLTRAEGIGVNALTADVSDRSQVQVMVGTIRREHGRLDIVVNNAGVIGFVKEAARELAPHRITVNSVCPGVIISPMTAQSRENPAVMERWMREIPMRRLGEPSEVAGLDTPGGNSRSKSA